MMQNLFQHGWAQGLVCRIIEQSDDLIVAIDPDLRFLAFNRAYRDEFEIIFGVAIETDLSLREAMAGFPEDLEHGEELWRRALHGEEFSVCSEFGDPLKERNNYEIKFSPILDGSGRVVGACHIARNITERLRNRKALRASNNGYRLLFANMTAGMALHQLIVDSDDLPRDYRILRINPAFQAQMGLAESRLVGKLASEAYQSPDPPFLETYARVVETGQPTEFEWNATALGKHFRIRAYATQERQFATIVEDVTAQITAQSAIAESRGLLQTIINTAPIRVFWKDRELNYLGCNPTFAKDAGMSDPEDVIGKNDYQLAWASQAERYRSDDRQVLDSGESKLFYEEPQSTPDGRSIWLSTSKVPLRNQRKEIIGVLGVYEDISERKRLADALIARERYQRALVDNFPFLVWLKDEEGRFLTVNQPFARACGYTSPELLDGKTDREIWPADLAKAYRTDDRAVLESGKPKSVEEPIEVDGQRFWYETFKSPVDIDGRVIGTVGFSRDITARKQDEANLRLAASVFANSYEGIMISDARNLIVDVNPAFSRITGYEREEIIGKQPSLLSSGLQGSDFYADMWHSLSTRDFWQGEIWNRRKTGELYAEMLSISVVRDEAGFLQHYIGIFSDITQLKAHEAELHRIAHYDILTGVPNRRLLADRLNQAIAHARRSRRFFAVCYLDLDGFKPINDRFGHAAGDRLLVEVTERLKKVLRSDDTLARLGGDEFVLLFTDLAHIQETEAVLERLLTAVSAPLSIEDTRVTLSASIGVTIYPEDNADADALLRHADQAMYRAKEAGRNRYHLFDPNHDRQIQDRRNQLHRMAEALLNREFLLHYQPKVDLLSGEIIGLEALIRWEHPELGLRLPAEFLPWMGTGELLVQVGEWVIDEVLGQIAAWSTQGLNISVSVNIGAEHLLQTDFPDRLRLALARHPEVPPNRLQLEILETAALADLEQAVRVLSRCRQLGVSFDLDDFGTGYSSLTYFRRLPVDCLKIDQSFVQDMLDDPDDLGIVESVTRMAKAFNRPVIAEGVETMDHGAMLILLGCGRAQGFGIARPMPAAQIMDWVAQWRREKPWQKLKRGVVAQDDLTLRVAGQSHRNWVDKVIAYLEHPTGEMPVSLDLEQCRFGHWYHGSGTAHYGELEEFKAIAEPHRQVHQLGAKIIQLADCGQSAEARDLVPELLALRDGLLGLIQAVAARATHAPTATNDHPTDST